MQSNPEDVWRDKNDAKTVICSKMEAITPIGHSMAGLAREIQPKLTNISKALRRRIKLRNPLTMACGAKPCGRVVGVENVVINVVIVPLEDWYRQH
jgi:hypothetical protein